MEATTRALVATQYTGANSADVLTMCQMVTQYSGNTWSIDPSSTADTLLLIEQGALRAQWPVTAGTWVVVALDFGIIGRLTDSAYKSRYRPISNIVTDAVAATSATIVKPAMYGGFGLATLPTLLVGAAATPVTVTIKPAQPDTDYVPAAWAISGAAVLTTVEVGVITKTSTNSCSVLVRNTGLVSIGGLLMVHITAPLPAPAK